jgi:hypothetical protein
VAIALTQLGRQLNGTVIQQVDDLLHVNFLDDELPGAEADRISLATVAELVRKTKDDHLGFIKRVADTVTAGAPVSPDSLPTRHQCRLGRWYDGISDTATLALPSFKALAEPHHAVHEHGHRALVALAAGDRAGADRCVATMKQHSDRTLRCLDEFGREYPSTMEAAASERQAA